MTEKTGVKITLGGLVFGALGAFVLHLIRPDPLVSWFEWMAVTVGAVTCAAVVAGLWIALIATLNSPEDHSSHKE